MPFPPPGKPFPPRLPRSGSGQHPAWGGVSQPRGNLRLPRRGGRDAASTWGMLAERRAVNGHEPLAAACAGGAWGTLRGPAGPGAGPPKTSCPCAATGEGPSCETLPRPLRRSCRGPGRLQPAAAAHWLATCASSEGAAGAPRASPLGPTRAAGSRRPKAPGFTLSGASQAPNLASSHPGIPGPPPSHHSLVLPPPPPPGYRGHALRGSPTGPGRKPGAGAPRVPAPTWRPPVHPRSRPHQLSVKDIRNS